MIKNADGKLKEHAANPLISVLFHVFYTAVVCDGEAAEN